MHVNVMLTVSRGSLLYDIVQSKVIQDNIHDSEIEKINSVYDFIRKNMQLFFIFDCKEI